MFNKYSLTFQSRTLEMEYRESQTTVVKTQYTAFAIQLYLILYSAYYFQNRPYSIAILLIICFVLIFIVFSKFIIDKYANAINLILPFLQFLIAFIHFIDKVFPADSDEEYYEWYSGFSACYFHMALFIQGYLLWAQTFVIVAILLIYVLCFVNYTYVYAILLLGFISIAVGMIAIKYNIESNKRQQFLHNRESKKWFTILDTILEQSIVVIKLDKQQDQLRIHQMNNITSRMLHIKDDNDLRTILRNLTYMKDSKISKKQNKITLESHIRNMLQKKQVATSTTLYKQRGSSDKFINTLYCQSQILENQFKVQIVNYWTDEQQMVIMATENLDDFTQNQDKQELNVKNRMITYLAKHCLQVYFKQKNNRFSQLQCMNYFASLNLFLNPQDFEQNRVKTYTQSQILQTIQQIFGKSVEIINKINIESIKVDLNSLLLVILTIFQFSSSDKAKIKLSTKTGEQPQLNVTVMCITKQISQNMKLYFSKSLFFFEESDLNVNIEKLKENLLILDKKLTQAQPLKAVTLTLLKYILWKYGSTTRVTLNQKNSMTQFKFSFLCQ